MRKTMSREGRVVAVKGNVATVAIDRKTACGECKMASTCRSSECKQMFVHAALCESQKVAVGQRVEVAVAAHSAALSVGIGYGAPLCVFVASCAVASVAGASDALVACVGLLSVVAYYGVLFLSRKRIDRHFVCSIVKVAKADDNEPCV